MSYVARLKRNGAFFAFLAVVFFALTSPVHAQGIFGGGGSGGSGSNNDGFFSGIRDSIQTIFDNIGAGTPGGAIIPGITPPPADTILGPAGTGVPPLSDSSKKIKLTLEWDALSVGGEAVDPDSTNPLDSQHRAALTCPPCPAYDTPSPDHPGPDWHYCAPQHEDPMGNPVEGCTPTQIEHTLYGWCGQAPEFKNSSRVPPPMKQAYEGPNTYTLPSAISNKYIRRDGYTYKCMRKCGDGVCLSEDNYVEFQTQVYKSNAFSLYVRAENLSNQDIENVVIKVNELTHSGEVSPLPHNVDYPVEAGEFEHGNTLEDFTDTINGTLVRVEEVPPSDPTNTGLEEGYQFVLGPFFLPAGESKFIPLQPTTSDFEFDEIPGAASNIAEPAPFAMNAEVFGESEPSLSDEFSKLADSFRENWKSLFDGVSEAFSINEPEKAYALHDSPGWCSCVGDPLADYMNTVMNEFTCGAASVSTPVLNASAPTGSCLFQEMAANGANMGGVGTVMANMYNLCDGRTITDQLDVLIAENPGKQIYLSEIGAINIGGSGGQGCVGRAEGMQMLKNEIWEISNNPAYSNVIGAALFNSFGYNPDFGYNIFNDDEIRWLMEGSDPSKFGVNTARTIGSTNPYARADALGLGSVVEIVASDQIDAVATNFAEAISRGITPVLRIGITNNSGGFDDPSDYADFLNELASRIGCGFIAIGGPNEPSLEPWGNDGCGDIHDNYVGQPPDSYTDGTWNGWYDATYPDNPLDPGGPISPVDIVKPLGVGAIVPRDFNFICQDGDNDDKKRCRPGGGGLPHYIISSSDPEYDDYRDTTGIGGCGYWASSNNSVIGPIQVVAEYGETGDDQSSRSVLVASIPIGGRILDDEARPYGWPVSGEIEQNWGFTGDANAIGYARSNAQADYGEYRCCGGGCVAPGP